MLPLMLLVHAFMTGLVRVMGSNSTQNLDPVLVALVICDFYVRKMK